MPKGKSFTQAEKNLLRALIYRNKDIVERKQTDSLTLQKKKETWNKITTEFNTRSNSHKDVTQLKKLWDNIKFRKKAETKSLLQGDFASTSSAMSPDFNPCSNILVELNENVDSDNFVLEPHTFMLVEENSLQNSEHGSLEMPTNIGEAQDMTNEEPTGKSKCSKNLESEKAQMLLQVEKDLAKHKIQEQGLRCQLLKVQLESARFQLQCDQNKELFLQQKRCLELELLKKQLRE